MITIVSAFHLGTDETNVFNLLTWDLSLTFSEQTVNEMMLVQWDFVAMFDPTLSVCE